MALSPVSCCWNRVRLRAPREDCSNPPGYAKRDTISTPMRPERAPSVRWCYSALPSFPSRCIGGQKSFSPVLVSVVCPAGRHPQPLRLAKRPSWGHIYRRGRLDPVLRYMSAEGFVPINSVVTGGMHEQQRRWALVAHTCTRSCCVVVCDELLLASPTSP